MHNGKHLKVPPPFRKATLKLINFSRSNRHIWLPRIVDEHGDIHSWTLLCCLKHHHIVMSIRSSHECVMLAWPFLKLLGVSNECQCKVSDGVTVFSHKDKRQRPCYVPKPQNTTQLATKRNRKENEAEDENQGRPTSGNTTASGLHTYETAILLMNRWSYSNRMLLKVLACVVCLSTVWKTNPSMGAVLPINRKYQVI